MDEIAVQENLFFETALFIISTLVMMTASIICIYALTKRLKKILYVLVRS